MTKTTGSIAASTNIVKESVVMGDVSIGADSTILFYAVLRGDDNKIIIGKGTNIQDNCTVHTSKVDPTMVGDYVTVGHNAILHGCTIGDNTLIGMGATVMNGSVIGKNCLIAARLSIPFSPAIAAGVNFWFSRVPPVSQWFILEQDLTTAVGPLISAPFSGEIPSDRGL